MGRRTGRLDRGIREADLAAERGDEGEGGAVAVFDGAAMQMPPSAERGGEDQQAGRKQPDEGEAVKEHRRLRRLAVDRP